MLKKFITATAVIALAAATVHADPGGGKGGDKANGGGKGGGDQAGRVQAGPERGNAKEGGNGKGKAPEARAEAPRGNSDKQARKPDRVEDRGNQGRGDDGAKDRGQRADKSPSRANGRDDSRSDSRVVRFDDRDGRDGRGDRFRWASLDRRDVVEGCPPGLAKKNNGCMPPGQAKKRYGDWREGYDRPDWWGLNGYDGRYSYHDGSLLRLGSNGSILGYLPLLGGSLAPGNLWPSFYEPVAVPDYYQDYYNLGSDDSYRYYDDAFYSVDPSSGAIGSIAALLTGDDFAVGQRLPQGYDVYNVPYSYRDEYADGPDANYRYSDGYVYQVDPQTQLIQTVIELLT